MPDVANYDTLRYEVSGWGSDTFVYDPGTNIVTRVDGGRTVAQRVDREKENMVPVSDAFDDTVHELEQTFETLGEILAESLEDLSPEQTDLLRSAQSGVLAVRSNLFMQERKFLVRGPAKQPEYTVTEGGQILYEGNPVGVVKKES